MDQSRRKFIIGMSAGYVALNTSMVQIFKSDSKSKIDKALHNNSVIDYTEGVNYFANDALSSAAIGSMITGLVFNNIEYLYSILIILVTLFLLFAIGIPGYEFLMPYSEYYFQ